MKLCLSVNNRVIPQAAAIRKGPGLVPYKIQRTIRTVGIKTPAHIYDFNLRKSVAKAKRVNAERELTIWVRTLLSAKYRL